MIVDDALIELLAIKLYEHDHDRYPPVVTVPWGMLSDDKRQGYRDAAGAHCAYGSGPDDKTDDEGRRQEEEDLDL